MLSALQNHSWHPAATAVAAPQVFHLIPSPYQAHAELLRILKPGGVLIHLEVPAKYESLDTWGRIRGDYEISFNNEPFWRGALTSDFGELVRAAGFKDVQTGYQDAVNKAVPGAGGFGDVHKGVHRCWFMVSGVK